MKISKIGFEINPESHKFNHANYLTETIPNYPDTGIGTRYINKILKEMATIYARLVNQYRFKYLIIASASFYKINEEDQKSDEIELFLNLIINNTLTENDIDINDIKSQLELQVAIQETKESGWIFDRSNAMKKKVF